MAMGVNVDDIRIDDMPGDVQTLCMRRAAEDFRRWINDEKPYHYLPFQNLEIHQRITKRKS